MTCIVGIEITEAEWPIVIIGGDCASSDRHHITPHARPKVFGNGSFIMGYTTSFRFGQLLEHAFTAPEHPEGMDDHKYLCTLFVDAMRDCLKQAGYSKVDNNVETGGDALLGYRGVLYTIYSDFQISRNTHGFDAVGSGYLPALGSLHTTRNSSKEPQDKLRAALEAAAELITTVRGPFRFIWLTYNKETGGTEIG